MVADCEIAVAGGGPAGLTAALFAARHGRNTILLDPIGSGGGILNTERVEDFPGFPEGVPGFELGPRIHEQAANAGAVFEMQEVRRIERRGDDWAVVTDSGEIVAGAAIVATGSRPAKLGVPREDEFEGKGLSHCASCDGPSYRGKAVAIVGAGRRGDAARAARTAGDQPPVRLRVGRDRRDDRRRAGGEATPGRRRRTTDLDLASARSHAVMHGQVGGQHVHRQPPEALAGTRERLGDERPAHLAACVLEPNSSSCERRHDEVR